MVPKDLRNHGAFRSHGGKKLSHHPSHEAILVDFRIETYGPLGTRIGRRWSPVARGSLTSPARIRPPAAPWMWRSVALGAP